MSVASALKIGPKIRPIFGFDLIVASNGLYFCMDLCEINHVQAEEKMELAEKLFLLHQLQIVHLDIKPDNIGFS